eukprot:sb/3468173/
MIYYNPPPVAGNAPANRTVMVLGIPMYKVQIVHRTFLNQLFETNPTQPELAFYLIGKCWVWHVHFWSFFGARANQRPLFRNLVYTRLSRTRSRVRFRSSACRLVHQAMIGRGSLERPESNTECLCCGVSARLRYREIWGVQSCADLYPRHCPKWAKKGFCDVPTYRKTLQIHCKQSCDFCSESTCMDLIDRNICEKYQLFGLCDEGHVKDVCGETCGTCKTRDVVKIECKDGFQHMSGSTYLECQADGSYNASAGVCISKSKLPSMLLV